MNTPKGKIIAIGGNEDKGTYPNPRTKRKYYLNFFELGILKRFSAELGKTNPRIEVITTASMIPEEVGHVYQKAFGILNITNVGLMHIRTPPETDLPIYLERLRQADGILFSGGDQARLTRMFANTEFLEICKQRYQQEESFVLAGTSAGAMAMSGIMIRRGSSFEALMKGTVKLDHGLSFLPNVIIDSHFVKRGRFGRLMEAVALHTRKIGIGLGEDTGVLITKGNLIETIGSNLVIIVDGYRIGYNNAHEANRGEPLSIENIIMHVLAKGNVYDIYLREFYKDAETHQRHVQDILDNLSPK
ncbi:cyanophycinase [Adhaeribacter arboris]|uniref:Cyanophycinase n=1 Tax=Adhaeribacter arboris TaxID=2072846 RepID=A0A2T2YBS5_9BACT|nr:cyanophycinase [Adhaeribacter arboris]PSR52959.1 cyanophycinase [Adhaeribacter arboris]